MNMTCWHFIINIQLIIDFEPTTGYGAGIWYGTLINFLTGYGTVLTTYNNPNIQNKLLRMIFFGSLF